MQLASGLKLTRPRIASVHDTYGLLVDGLQVFREVVSTAEDFISSSIRQLPELFQGLVEFREHVTNDFELVFQSQSLLSFVLPILFIDLF